MAITRSQQVKQMLREGGRLGYRFGGGYQGGSTYDEEVGVNTPDRRQTYDSPQQSFKDSVPESSYDAPTGAVDDPFKSRGQSPDYFTTTNTTGYDEEVGVNTPPRNTGGRDDVIPSGGRDDLMTFRNTPPKKSNFPGIIGVGVNALNAIFPNLRKRNIDYFLDNQAIDRSDYPTTIEGYKRYMRDRSSGIIDASGRDITDKGGRDDPMPLIYNQGQVGIRSGDNEETEDSTNNDPFEPNFRLLADGGMPDDAPVGGIMDLETGRQMYFLGKLVKKATRAVKKVAKSPIGKAALIAGLGIYGGGGLGVLKNKGLGALASNFFSKANPLLFSKGKLSLGKLAALSAASPFLFQQDEEEQDFYRGPSLDMPGIEDRPMDFINPRLAADGGLMRIGYQEGSKEPVAKKTMPLLDMNGKEKDYRETGGFVDMGRMERADDVPARLSKNEFVFTADAVRNAGEGNIDKGAEVMYNMMKNLEAGGEVSEESQGLEGARRMFQTSQRLGEVI